MSVPTFFSGRSAGRAALALGVVLPAVLVQADEPAARREIPKVRTFLFTYSARVTGLPPGKEARIWLPLPPSNAEQEVKIESKELPGKEEIGTDPTYGNKILYVEGKADAAGTIPVSITYLVTRKEVKTDFKRRIEDTEVLYRYLRPDALGPIGGKPLSLVPVLDVPTDQLAAGKMFYDAVNNHMKYSKEGKGWGRGDAVWACDSKFGNCSDFHSLFISLARTHKIPAKFEMGFPLPPKRGAGDIGGYHCWAWFRPSGKGWVPVDISEANKEPKLRDYYFGNLTEDRVAFSTGRDIELSPKQDGEKLNFFIYPHVEVDGKPYDASKVTRKFSFKDVHDLAK
jgi:transglutaminase-like putative cysteine protease